MDENFLSICSIFFKLSKYFKLIYFIFDNQYFLKFLIDLKKIEMQPMFRIIGILIHVLSGFMIISSIFIISFLLYLFFKNKHLIRNTINLFILNIIVNDLLKSIIYIPVSNVSFQIVIDTLQIVGNNETQPINLIQRNILCNLNFLSGIFFETIQLMAMTLISFERYRMITFPPKTPSKQMQLTKWMILISWIFSLSLTLLVFSAISYVSDFENLKGHHCHIDLFYLNLYSFDNHISQGSVGYSKERDVSLLQNQIYDGYNITITIAAIGVIFWFYAKIYFYLKLHEKKISEKKIVNRHKSNMVSPVRFVFN